MDDRALLERAARAAGIEGVYRVNGYRGVCGINASMDAQLWNPLINDRDALQLAVKLHIDLCINNACAEAIWIDEAISETHSIMEYCDEAFEGLDAKYAATRRAIVRAAAALAED